MNSAQPNTPRSGVYVNPHGGRSPVQIVSMVEETTKFPGGGNPFSVTTVDVEIEFDGPINPFTKDTRMRLRGYPRSHDGTRYLGFYGSCADSDIRSVLVLDD